MVCCELPPVAASSVGVSTVGEALNDGASDTAGADTPTLPVMVWPFFHTVTLPSASFRHVEPSEASAISPAFRLPASCLP